MQYLAVGIGKFNNFGLPVKGVQDSMALRMIDHGTKEYLQMVNLRNEILRKPLGLGFDKTDLEQEKEDILMGAFEDDRLLGCCLMTRVDATTVRLRQMAVPNNMQGKGIGRAH